MNVNWTAPNANPYESRIDSKENNVIGDDEDDDSETITGSDTDDSDYQTPLTSDYQTLLTSDHEDGVKEEQRQ